MFNRTIPERRTAHEAHKYFSLGTSNTWRTSTCFVRAPHFGVSRRGGRLRKYQRHDCRRKWQRCLAPALQQVTCSRYFVPPSF